MMRSSRLCLVLGAPFAMSFTAPAPAQGPSLAHESPGQFVARCIREKSPAAANPAQAPASCRAAFASMMGSRRVAQLLIEASPVGNAKEDVATLKQRLGPLSWKTFGDRDQTVAEIGDGWYAITHGVNPATALVTMWQGQGPPAFALPGALRWLGAKVDPLFCQIKPGHLDRVFWLNPPGKAGMYFQISESQPDKDGIGEYAALMKLAYEDRPPAPAFTAQERADGYTLNCPSEF